MVPTWKTCWRKGIAPQLTDRHLEVLRDGLRDDDPALIQSHTVLPWIAHDPDVVGACAVAYCGWKGDLIQTCHAVEEFFDKVCNEADRRLGDKKTCRWFMNWFDETPRDEMRREFLAEVQRTLDARLNHQAWVGAMGELDV